MKKIIQFLLVSFAICLIATPVSAQRGIKLSGYLMPQNTWLYNADDVELDRDVLKYEFTTGMAGGFEFGYNPVDNFGLRIGAVYSQQGQRFSTKESPFDRSNYYTRLEYFKIPIMLGIHSNAGNSKIRFAFYGGFQLGFLTRAWTHNDDTDYELPYPSNWTQIPETWEQYNVVNVSLFGETGIDIRLDYNWEMNLRLRAEGSINDAENKNATFRITENGFTRDQDWYPTGRARTRNIVMGLRIGLTYTIEPLEKVSPVAPPTDL